MLFRTQLGGVRVLTGGSYPETEVVDILLELLELLLYPQGLEEESEFEEREEQQENVGGEEEEEHEWHGSGHWWGVSMEAAAPPLPRRF